MIESNVCRVIFCIETHKAHALPHAKGKSSLASIKKVSSDIKAVLLTFVRTTVTCQPPMDHTASWEIKA